MDTKQRADLVRFYRAESKADLRQRRGSAFGLQIERDARDVSRMDADTDRMAGGGSVRDRWRGSIATQARLNRRYGYATLQRRPGTSGFNNRQRRGFRHGFGL